MKLIDMHAHVLPGADHGSDSVEVSRKQLELLAGAGIGTVVATPHFYPQRHTVSEFLRRRRDAFDKLTASDTGDIRVICGAEVLLCEGMDEMDNLGELCIEGTNTLLLEMPMHPWSTELLDTVERIRNAGLVPVLAHLDRYPEAWHESVLELGVGVQLNADSLCRLIGSKKYKKMIYDGIAVGIGSDIHGADAKAAHRFASAVKAIGQAECERLTERTARLITEK